LVAADSKSQHEKQAGRYYIWSGLVRFILCHVIM